MTKPLSNWGKLFFGLVNAAGLTLYVYALAETLVRSSTPLPWGYVALFAMTLAAGMASVRIPGTHSLISLADAFVFSAVIFYGPVPAVLLAGTDGFVGTRRLAGRLLSASSSLSVMCISVMTAGVVYERLLSVFWNTAEGRAPFEMILVPVAGMALTHFLLNSSLVAALTAFARRRAIYRTWRESFLWTSLTFFAGASAAALGYLFVERLGPASFVIGLPILSITYVTYRTYLGRVDEKNRHIAGMNRVHLETIEALAMAIDAKGQTTYGHMRRVQAYAVGLAELAGADETTLEGVRTAALLHDVGKLAVPDYILNKPGPLTRAEYSKLKTYPRIGAEILANVEFPYPVVSFIRHHKEHWDGSGYPYGLAGGEIPLGARILAIANSVDAMRCPRPYRSAASLAEVKLLVRQSSGTEFDPALVDLFVANIDLLETRAKSVGLPKMEGVEEIASIHREHAASLYGERRDPVVLTDIVAARNESLALYEMIQLLGASLSLKDALSIMMERLRRLVAFDSGAVYLVDEKSALIVPAHAEGDEADLIRRKSFRRGEGITGWVVENAKSMVNARPELDFYGDDIEAGRGYRSAAVFPLNVGGNCIGTITLYARRENQFGTEVERILDRIAPQAAAAIQNARSFEETRGRALTDALTSLPNSRYLYMQLEQELARAKRNVRPLGIVVLDLDRFKPVNDTYGHHVGDEVLRQVSKYLVDEFRACDTVCRWAGDEFVVLLPESNPELVEATVTRVQKGLEDLWIPVPPTRTVRVGASAGWASYPLDGEGFEELMRVADKRMYRNKTERHAMGRPTIV